MKNPQPQGNRSAIKVSIALDSDTLKMADAEAARRHTNRSVIIRQAILDKYGNDKTFPAQEEPTVTHRRAQRMQVA